VARQACARTTRPVFSLHLLPRSRRRRLGRHEQAHAFSADDQTMQFEEGPTMNMPRIIKAVEMLDGVFELITISGATVTVTARENVAPDKVRLQLTGGKESRTLSWQHALAHKSSTTLFLMNADDLTELLDGLTQAGGLQLSCCRF
jgi:hypothetical protein